MTRHLAKLLDTIWYVSMGLFLGLTGGLVLSVILTFRGAREIDATPGVEPFSDPKFAEYHNDAVAGYIGQDLFEVGGTIAFTLLVIAILSRMMMSGDRKIRRLPVTGSKIASNLRALALAISILTLDIGPLSIYARDMQESWAQLYDPQATPDELIHRRDAFDQNHQISERLTGTSWLCGLLALGISPWCRRPADGPSQTSTPQQ